MGILSHGSFVFAAGICACTTTTNDCQTTPLTATNQTSKACTDACKKTLGDKLTSSDFAEATEGEILEKKCLLTHKTFTEKEASSKSTGVTKPKSPPTDLLTPKLNIDIPGLTFSNALSGPCSFDKNETCVKTNFLGEYLNALYTYLITTATLIAIVMIMVGGLQYTLGASTKNGVEKGKERIKNGVTGLVLLLAVFLILQTTSPQLVFMKIIELQNVEEIEFEDAAVDAGSTVAFDPSVKTGAPSTKGDGAVITRLLGPPPSSLAPCSKAMFNYIADALSKKNVCVGPMHCAYAASNFLEYAKCTNIYNGNASWLPASLDASGWSAETIRTAKQFSTLPIGLLVMPGHVGISLEDGYQFDSGGSTLQFLKNQSGSQTCISNSLQSRKDGGCDYCSVIPEEAPRTGKYAKDSSSENQGWYKVKAAGSWRGDPSRGTWQIILVPPSQASRITPSPKAPCTIKAGGITRTVTISKNLCTMIQLPRAEWKALNPKP